MKHSFVRVFEKKKKWHVQVDIKVEDFLWDSPAKICRCGLLFSNKSHLFSLGHEIPRMRRKAGWIFACLYLPSIAVSLHSAGPFTPSQPAVDLSRDSPSFLLLSRQNTDTFSVSLYLLQMFCSSLSNYSLFWTRGRWSITLQHAGAVLTKTYTPHSCVPYSSCSLWFSLVPRDFSEPRFFKYPWSQWYCRRQWGCPEAALDKKNNRYFPCT